MVRAAWAPPMTAAPLLLRAPLAETDLAPRCLDFQVRVGRPALIGADGAAPCVVVLTRTADREIDQLSLRLAARGIPLLRLDSDRAGAEPVSYDLERDVLCTPDGDFRPVVAWARYFQPSAVAVGGDPRAAAYARDQWLPWARTVLASPAATVLDGPGAPDRIAQLVLARAAGLRTPATMVTTAPAQAARRLPGDGDLVVKTLGEHFVEPVPGRLTGIAPRRVTRAELAAEAAPEPAPVIVQELVAATRELRVYAVGARLVAFAVTRGAPEERWADGGGLRATTIHLPSALAWTLRALVRRLGLDVAAFDLLDTPTGPVFLEVNAPCDWLWCEAPAGCTPVSAAVRALVGDRFEAR